MTSWHQVTGTVMRGHGVASGQAQDPRFPGGTLRMQMPIFASQGLCLDAYFPGTINVSIHPKCYTVRQAKHTFRQVQWADQAPAEDFSFFDCQIVLNPGRPLPGLIYYPHPETKPEHFQAPATLEVLTDYIEGLRYGMVIGLKVDASQLKIE